MQRLAGFQQCARRCESPSSPHASLQRQHVHTLLLIHNTSTIHFQGCAVASAPNRPQLWFHLQDIQFQAMFDILFLRQTHRIVLFKLLVIYKQKIWQKPSWCRRWFTNLRQAFHPEAKVYGANIQGALIFEPLKTIRSCLIHFLSWISLWAGNYGWIKCTLEVLVLFFVITDFTSGVRFCM